MEIKNKNELLDKLQSYSKNPDDENIRYKELIKKKLLNCPELLYALHEPDLEKELFNEDGTLNADENGDLAGEVSRFFGTNQNIRPYLFIPETQTDVKNMVCYQVSFDSVGRYNNFQKYTLVTFTIFCQEQDIVDELTGIPRHDLIACILRDKFNWSNIFGMQSKLISSKESIADNHYLVRTIVFEMIDLNGTVTTSYGGKPDYTNYHLRR